ncbi:MAG: DUF4293 family protein [Rhodothermales bacterium]
MIQRIQTVYLVLGAVALVSLLFFSGLWNGASSEAQAWFTPAVFGIGGLAAVVALVAVFLFKDRPRQRKVIVAAQILTVLHLLVFYLGLFLAGALYIRTARGLNVEMLVALLLPLVAYLLFFLARRSVEKDIELVRSMDRLR